VFRKGKFEQELDEELRSYVELQAAEKVRRGMSPEDALREARRERGALRTLGRNRAFALIAILRMASGATRGAVMHLVIGHAAKLVGTGIALGFAGAALLSRMISTVLYGVAPFDPVTLGSVTTLLALVGFTAVYVPARRAAKSDPMESLRHD
jgi:ABC-type lipoprotein release transport system permease subunit